MCMTSQPLRTRPIGLPLRGSPVFKRRGRNVRRSQLVCSSGFTSGLVLDMPCSGSVPQAITGQIYMFSALI